MELQCCSCIFRHRSSTFNIKQQKRQREAKTHSEVCDLFGGGGVSRVPEIYSSNIAFFKILI